MHLCFRQRSVKKETNKGPNLLQIILACLAHAAICVGVSSNLAIRYRIYPVNIKQLKWIQLLRFTYHS